MSDNTLIIQDEKGKETEYEILFTFTDEDSEKSYVVYKEPGDSDEVFAAVYNEKAGDSGTLSPVETEKEWDMIEKKLERFLDNHDEK